MYPCFPHVANFYEDEGKRFLQSNLYLSAKRCGFLFEQSYEVTVKLRLYDVQRSLHTLGPFWFLILVRSQPQCNKMFSITLITMKWATPSKKECVLFPFQTQFQRSAISTWGDCQLQLVMCHGSGSYPLLSVVEKEEQGKVFLWIFPISAVSIMPPMLHTCISFTYHRCLQS